MTKIDNKNETPNIYKGLIYDEDFNMTYHSLRVVAERIKSEEQFNKHLKYLAEHRGEEKCKYWDKYSADYNFILNNLDTNKK